MRFVAGLAVLGIRGLGLVVRLLFSVWTRKVCLSSHGTVIRTVPAVFFKVCAGLFREVSATQVVVTGAGLVTLKFGHLLLKLLNLTKRY